MRILLTGGSGMLGSALQRLAPTMAPDVTVLAPTRAELPLTDAAAVAAWFAANPVDAVIHGAARVGGIQANIDHPVDFGSRLCDYITKSCENRHYKTLIPCNLFGTEDHFGSVASHLIAAIVTKVVQARDAGEASVEIWGSGNARREFLFVDDLVQFMLTCLPKLDTLPQVLNVGYGTDHSVTEYYEMIGKIAGYTGTFHHDLSRPEGMMAKCMTSAVAADLGFTPQTKMPDALAAVVAAYEAQVG